MLEDEEDLVKNPEIPSEKPTIGEIKSMVQKVIPKIEEFKPEVPQIKPRIEEVKPEVPKMKPKIEEVKPEVPKFKPKMEEVKPEVPKMKPKIEEVKPEVPKTKPRVEEAPIVREVEMLPISEVENVVLFQKQNISSPKRILEDGDFDEDNNIFEYDEEGNKRNTLETSKAFFGSVIGELAEKKQFYLKKQ